MIYKFYLFNSLEFFKFYLFNSSEFCRVSELNLQACIIYSFEKKSRSWDWLPKMDFSF